MGNDCKEITHAVNKSVITHSLQLLEAVTFGSIRPSEVVDSKNFQCNSRH